MSSELGPIRRQFRADRAEEGTEVAELVLRQI